MVTAVSTSTESSSGAQPICWQYTICTSAAAVLSAMATSLVAFHAARLSAHPIPGVKKQRLHQCRSFLQSFFGGSMNQTKHLQNSEPTLTTWTAADNLKVVPQQLEGQGRGLVANKSIKVGEQVLAVPGNRVVFPSTAAAECVLAPLLPEDAGQLPDWTLLVLFLAEQYYYMQRDMQLPNSTWVPYLQSLPRHPLGTILDWPAEEVPKLLSGSGLLQKAQVILAAADALWRDIQPVVSAGKQQGLCPSDMYSRADITWATGICLSRSIRLDDKGGVVVLCPFADLFNHSCDSEAYLVWDAQQQAVVLRADRTYKAGEEVTISYGSKSSGELLLSYGFCPPAGSNPYDAAFVTFGPEITDPLMQEKKRSLAARGLPPMESFGLLIDALPSGLLPYAAFYTARPKNATAADIEKLAVQLFDRGELPDIDGVSSELKALEAVVKQCRAALPGYKQSAVADKQLAQTVQNGGGFAQRAALVAVIRCREQQILSRTEFVALQRIRALKSSNKRV